MIKKASPVTVRLSGDELSCKAIHSILAETFLISNYSLRQNDDGLIVRVYFTIKPLT